MYRRAYVLLISIAATMGLLAIIAAISLDKRLADPDGFLGPAWVRLPMLLAGAFVMDMLPRVVTSLRPPRRNLKELIRERHRRALDARADHARRPRASSASTSPT